MMLFYICPLCVFASHMLGHIPGHDCQLCGKKDRLTIKNIIIKAMLFGGAHCL